MKTQTRAVVIGGGIAGCSTLYHLTREGWTDVVLVERDEITSGTTWHSAAQVTNFGMTQTMVGLKSHSIRLYKELAEDPEHPITYHHADGGIRLANDPRVMDGYRHFASMAKGMGVDFEVIDAAECARRHPLISTDNLIGGLWDPLDGDIDPAGLCHALLRRARADGAEVYRQTPVTGLTQHRDDSWTVHTPRGDIRTEVIVNACGYRVNELGAMMGVEHPVASMEHQYFITEPFAELQEMDERVPLLRCPISDFYSRQEKKGLLIGFYEQECRTWGMDGIDPAFSSALCPDDVDRVLPVLENVFERMPVLQDVGIKSIVNGPITYTMDGAPLVGPIPGKRNAFCIIGLRAGLGEGGGHGWLLAQQIVHGEAELDTWVIDPRRFGPHANVELTALKAIEDYQNEFRFHFPHEHRPAGRPMRTTPLTAVLAAEGADFGMVDGWERIAYIRPGPDFIETHGYRFKETFDVVADEVRAVHEGVGLTEVNGFTRFEITGGGAADWLDAMTCGRIPRRAGRVGLAYLLNHHGCIKSEATLACLPDGRIWYGAAAAAERHDMDWLTRHMPDDGSVRLRNLTRSHTILLLAGPRARAVLQEVARGDWSAEAFPWLSVREGHIGHAPATIMAVSYSGESAFELHIPNESLAQAWQSLRAAGAARGMRLFGSYAVESMRLEKSYRHWKADLVTEFDPFESGLGRFVDMRKDFLGKAALEARAPQRAFVTLLLEADHAPAQGGASIRVGGDVVGTVTSAGWGHRTGRNIAMGFVRPELAGVGSALSVDVTGAPVAATVTDPCLFDPENLRVRA
ncbi:FAD-dependent oxidoreductase [Aestuariicoccus sp. MJ-SS9]|uniref:GcvT family protein n=1 Tax=Aestuariicoccus sp. MJ-SS9 TaxID=3079855 RepID=UPI002909FBC4|nr:FAD-dependent oxidoreductase [Aestuariicoccus sp. MJ-SS9]MDU8910638.1 FAD-dependent oxidoreductase [Aestuariicoccus sp. MJ-SS9]